MIHDAHRHIGVLPAHPFYGGPAVRPDVSARATVKQLFADLDAEGTERALVLPNYGVPDPDVAFSFNGLVIEAAQKDDRITAGLWVSPRPEDSDRTAVALSLAGEEGVRALKLSFLLGGHPTDPACRPMLDRIFHTAERFGLVVHIHTSPGAASDIDEVGHLVEWYADRVPIHLVHFGGGMSGHIKLAGSRFFDWVTAGKRVYTDLSWALGFAPRWLVSEIERRGVGHDRLLFASDQPWGDFAGEHAKLAAAAGDGELGRLVFRSTFADLYDRHRPRPTPAYAAQPAPAGPAVAMPNAVPNAMPHTMPNAMPAAAQNGYPPPPHPDTRIPAELPQNDAPYRLGERFPPGEGYPPAAPQQAAAPYAPADTFQPPTVSVQPAEPPQTPKETAMPESTAELTDIEQKSLTEIPHPSLPEGSSIYGSTKVFPDYRAEHGESYFTLVHGIAHESSVSFVAVLQATRALRKGFETAIYFYGPGSLNCLATRGFPTVGNSAFPGEHNINNQLRTFIAEGGKAYCCRFGLSLHGAREEDLIEGVIPTHPLDVQDALIHYARKGAIINSTYQL